MTTSRPGGPIEVGRGAGWIVVDYLRRCGLLVVTDVEVVEAGLAAVRSEVDGALGGVLAEKASRLSSTSRG